jgi:hypothetical protein
MKTTSGPWSNGSAPYGNFKLQTSNPYSFILFLYFDVANVLAPSSHQVPNLLSSCSLCVLNVFLKMFPIALDFIP